MPTVLANASVSPTALWVGIALAVVAVLVFVKHPVLRIVVIILTAMLIGAAKTNGIL